MSALRDKALMPAGPLSAGHRLGRYEILAKLASGGMAVVYVASAQGAAGFERLVALKVLHANLAYEDEFIHMFLDEARLAARIRHPNVVPTIDISDSIQTGYFLVMEYIEGDHLGALLSGAHRAGGRLSLAVILRIVADALAGLGAAHALADDNGRPLQLVHRDVSPHNVLVGCDGVSRLTDFGVAKAEDRLTHTRDGQVKGKLAYMAPEQASSGVSDQRSDLFSMGIILWECVTGRRLFRADSTAATLHKLLNDEIAPPSAIDPDLTPFDGVLRKALDRDPSARFQSTDEFIEAIETVARHTCGLAPRRAVAEAVRSYAADKLAREHNLIAAGRRALTEDGTVAVSTESEPPRQSETSLSSLSRSKPSGVFSSRTAPGLFRRPRSSRPTPHPVMPGSPLHAVVKQGLPLPPPPLGSVAAEDVPEAPVMLQDPPQSRSALWFSLAVLFALGLSAWALLRAALPGDVQLPHAMQAHVIEAPSASSVGDVAPDEPAAQQPAATAAPEPPPAPRAVTSAAADESAPAPAAQPSATPVTSSARATRRNDATHGARTRTAAPEGGSAQPVGQPHDLLPNPYKH
jgi:serine/threonine-protein kinase